MVPSTLTHTFTPIIKPQSLVRRRHSRSYAQATFFHSHRQQRRGADAETARASQVWLDVMDERTQSGPSRRDGDGDGPEQYAGAVLPRRGHHSYRVPARRQPEH